MRIAIPVSDGTIAPHLGLCQSFLVADVENGVILREVEYANPGHGPDGPPPTFVANLGVDQVLAAGIPRHGQWLLEQRGVSVLLGATGDPRVALRAYVNGELAPSADGHRPGGCGCK